MFVYTIEDVIWLTILGGGGLAAMFYIIYDWFKKQLSDFKNNIIN